MFVFFLDEMDEDEHPSSPPDRAANTYGGGPSGSANSAAPSPRSCSSWGPYTTKSPETSVRSPVTANSTHAARARSVASRTAASGDGADVADDDVLEARRLVGADATVDDPSPPVVVAAADVGATVGGLPPEGLLNQTIPPINAAITATARPMTPRLLHHSPPAGHGVPRSAVAVDSAPMLIGAVSPDTAWTRRSSVRSTSRSSRTVIEASTTDTPTAGDAQPGAKPP